MNADPNFIATWITTIIVLISAVIAIIKFIQSSAEAARARKDWEDKIEKDMKLRDDGFQKQFIQIDSRFDEIKQILGNGAYHGLRQEIHDLQLEQASLKQQVEDHVKANI